MPKPSKQKRAEKIQKKEYLTNMFLVQFVVAFVYSMYVWTHMRLYSNHAILARNITIWTPVVMAGLALIFAVIPCVWKRCPTGGWWRTFCYSSAFLGLLYCILNLHVALGRATAGVTWLSFAKFGNEFSGIKLLFGWIWLVGFVICFIRYMVLYNRISKQK